MQMAGRLFVAHVLLLHRWLKLLLWLLLLWRLTPAIIRANRLLHVVMLRLWWRSTGCVHEWQDFTALRPRHTETKRVHVIKTRRWHSRALAIVE